MNTSLFNKKIISEMPDPISVKPIVRLVGVNENPYDTSIAAARTCYSSKLVQIKDVSKDEKAIAQRNKIAEGIYEAGHHTVFQHAHFIFTLENVSRQFVWSFLHSHPFYNSEQVSQRYVEVKADRFFIPPLQGASYQIYCDVQKLMVTTYQKLCDCLYRPIADEYFRIFPGRRSKEALYQKEIKKRAQEAARYVLPIGTLTQLYHTVSGLTLYRYHRMCQNFDVPYEQKLVILQMIECVRQYDSDFLNHIVDPLPIEETPEYQIILEQKLEIGTEQSFIDEFDNQLGDKQSVLIGHLHNSSHILGQSVRQILGLRSDQMSDAKAIDFVLNPNKNKLLGETLRLGTFSQLTRSLAHIPYVFHKKLSHTADSQDQRHRMVPGSRPLLFRQINILKPDYIMPVIIQKCEEAKSLFENAMNIIWKGIQDLLSEQVPFEFALYLLPNAFPIRFIESGNLLFLHHKLTTRLCYTAQEEIWRCSLDEIREIQRVNPEIGKYLGAPCHLRLWAAQTPYCPEGSHYCGVPVWKLGLDQCQRVI